MAMIDEEQERKNREAMERMDALLKDKKAIKALREEVAEMQGDFTENMPVYDNVYEFHYIDKKDGWKHVFYARDTETADKMAEARSKLGHRLVRRRFRFKTKWEPTTIPPYELEQSQFEEIERKMAHAKAYFRNHPEEAAQRGVKPEEYEDED